MLLYIFEELFTWLMLFIILLNISQRKFPRSDAKRKATLLIAVDFLAVYALTALVSIWQLPPWMDLICLAIGIAAAVIFRKSVWPFRLHCRSCGRRLDFNHIIGYDENICQECYWKEHPEEKEAEDAKNRTPEERLEDSYIRAGKVDDIQWDAWEPTETCVLTYVTDGPRILMIMKKKGLGAGYINAPGGHIEIEETKKEAAIRETKEETGLDVSDLEERGTLRFQFRDGLRMLGYVFFTSSWSGTMIEESEETKPFWTDIADLDYGAMWEDDRMWLPMALEGKRFNGYFIFDDRKMVDGRVDEAEEEDPVIELDEDTEL